jgi:predicted ATPase/DNA-binding SARP family transcriptional activator/DNA-binding CsgD family transcriptional regulator/Tfp pilus assembly protein PilF
MVFLRREAKHGSPGLWGMTKPVTTMGDGPETMRVWLLGDFRVSIGARTIADREWRLRKAASLVKVLALAPGHRLHREQVMDLLWPHLSKEAAANNLRQVLHGARRIIDPTNGSRYLTSDGESLVMCPGGELWVDADAFEVAATTARRAQEPSAHRAAIDLYAGDLLPEDRYEAWTEDRREELRQLYLALLVGLAKLHEERDEYGPAFDALRKATTEDPLLEEAHAGLMRLLALSGKPEQALAQYERLRSVLSRTLGQQPTEGTVRLHDEITAGRFPPAEPPRVEDPTLVSNHNLPAPMTTFVGREREMVEVKRTLAMTRLLTLTGAGGSGKTRLALEVARDLVGAYPDGVWMVQLAPLSAPDLVTQEVAGVLGIKERPGQSLTDTLADDLRAKKLLLVLDNCEHLVEPAALLVDKLLASCPRLKVLATSREMLAVSGEVNRPVPPLSLPAETNDEPRGGPIVEDLVRCEAVRLFVDRTRLRLPDFRLNEENAGAVARVCRKLDGIPLAIELATARIGTLAVEQVAQRLDVSLDVLKGSIRIAETRQRTLRATLDWSYRLLSQDERAVFRRLSVFAGGWTLQAAEAVCSGGGIDQEAVLDLLGGLVDKSLVVTAQSTGGAARHRMLEPIRQYAGENLAWESEIRSVQSRHAAFFLSLGEEAKTRWKSPEETAWFDRLEHEHDNLRTALRWVLDDEDPELGLRLVSALSEFWVARGHYSEGIRWSEEVLDASGASAPQARAEVLNGLGSILWTLSDFGGAQTCHERALRLYEEIGSSKGIADSLFQLGLAASSRNDAARATTHFEESLEVARRSGYEEIILGVLMGLAWVACDAGDIDRAQQMWGDALEMAREQEDRSGALYALFFIGYTELARGNDQRATVLLEEALALSRELGHKHIVEGCFMSLGIVTTRRGDAEEAKTLLGKSLAINLELGTKADMAEDLLAMAQLAVTVGEDLRAATLWGAADATRESIGNSWSPTERLLHEPRLIAARSRSTESSWEAAFAEGQKMTFEEAVEYARSEGKSHPPTTLVTEHGPTDKSTGNLTHREREVALLVTRGLTNRQISTELSISERTAANHVAKILRKLGLRSRAQIAAHTGAFTAAAETRSGVAPGMVASDG